MSWSPRAQELWNRAKEEPETPRLSFVFEEHPRCHICGSAHMGGAGQAVMSGFTQDVVRRYKCLDCGHTQTAGVYLQNKFTRDVIFRAIRMIGQGYSYRVISEAITDWTGRSVTGQSVRRWAEKYRPEFLHLQRARRPTPATLRAVRSRGRGGPVMHLFDFRSTRRVQLDEPFWDLVVHGTFESRPDIYQKKFHRAAGTRYLSIDQCRASARMLGLTMRQLERHAVAIYAGKSGQSKRVAVRFPLRANRELAFLIGLFYSSGGATSDLHFAVDKQVGEYLQSPAFVAGVGEAPTNLMQGSKLRKAHGTHSFAYSITMLDILRHFGLKTTPHLIHLGDGKWVPSRGLTVRVPTWIRHDLAFRHRFVEGYINGLHISAGLAGRMDYRKPIAAPWSTDMRRVTYANVKISFSNRNEKELLQLVRLVVKHLKAFGVDGWTSHLRQDGRKMQHYSYGFHSLGPLESFYRHFLVLRPNVEAKLRLRLDRNPLTVHILQKTKDLDNFVLGTLMKGPRTLDELADLCPRRPYNMPTSLLLAPSLTRLERMGVLVKKGTRWVYSPRRFALEQAQYYADRLKRKQGIVDRLRNKQLYICYNCHDVGTSPTCETCGRRGLPRCTDYQLRRFRDNKAVYLVKALRAAAGSSGTWNPESEQSSE